MGVYIHWPFCAAKCPYCDFNSHVRARVDHARWQEAYRAAIRHYAEKLPERLVVSVFFGGGTPSLMPASTVAAVIDEIQRGWRVVNDLEVTLEANPTSVEAEKFAAFREAGVTRVSLGVQALNDDDLAFLGREHSAAEAVQAIAIAQDHFERTSFDLIYARPRQTMAAWEEELRRAVDLAHGHLSLYQLTIERSTPFYMRHARDEFPMPGDAQGADFYGLTQEVTAAAGLPAYEVSNHAAAGQECRHNLVYWRYADYIGIGPGAHGRFTVQGKKYASRDHSAPEVWLERVEAGGTGAHPLESLSPEDRFTEGLMMGLRLTDGVDIAALSGESGKEFASMINQDNLRTIIGQEWAVYDGRTLRLTQEGTLRLNAILPFLLA